VSYPVTFEADYVERRSRLTTLFRIILAIPALIVLALYGIAALIATVIAWFAIVITAHFPRVLYEFVAGYTRSLARVTAYIALVCDPYPPFGGAHHPSYPVRMDFSPLEHYSRLKTFFRFILAIPIVLLRYVIDALLRLSAVFGWFVIVVLGRLPRGLFDVMVLANSFIARSDAYIFLLTETYPPFQDEQTRAAGVEPAPPSDRPSAAPSSPGESVPGT
jgi:hypothetical protein